MNIKRIIQRIVFCALIIILPTKISANDVWFALTWENDFIAREDSGYTNGMGLSWGYSSADAIDDIIFISIKPAALLLPGMNAKNRSYSLSYRIAQSMYTPEDIEETNLITNDQPYAGVLLWHANIHAFNEKNSDRYWLTLGLVGPVTGAAQVQKFIHKMINKKKPNGWENQLNNEAIFALSAERLWRLQTDKLTNTIDYDWIAMSAGDVGTMRSEIGFGIGYRIGQALGRSFSAASIIPGRNINPLTVSLKDEWHLFANLYTRYVLNDITLDGNTFRDSHSVDIKHEQILYAAGASYNAKHWGFVFYIEDGSSSFKEQTSNSLFASLSLSYGW